MPRFSLRWMMGAVAVAGVASLVLSFAVRGQPWAIGLCLALAWMLLALTAHVLLFLVAWQVAQLMRLEQSYRTSSPFASVDPPPPGSTSGS